MSTNEYRLMALEKKLREICDAIKKRNPEKSVSVDMVVWNYSSGNRKTYYKVWIAASPGISEGKTKEFASLEELIAYEKSLPVRNPILFRKFS